MLLLEIIEKGCLQLELFLQVLKALKNISANSMLRNFFLGNNLLLLDDFIFIQQIFSFFPLSSLHVPNLPKCDMVPEPSIFICVVYDIC